MGTLQENEREKKYKIRQTFFWSEALWTIVSLDCLRRT